jgi:hypothetical protein
MPSLVARRNCNATISSSPLQGVSSEGHSDHANRAGLVFLLRPHLGHASSRACEFAVSRSDYVRDIVSSTEPLMPCTNESLGPGPPKAGMKYLLGDLPLEQAE